MEEILLNQQLKNWSEQPKVSHFLHVWSCNFYFVFVCALQEALCMTPTSIKKSSCCISVVTHWRHIFHILPYALSVTAQCTPATDRVFISYLHIGSRTIVLTWGSHQGENSRSFALRWTSSNALQCSAIGIQCAGQRQYCSPDALEHEWHGSFCMKLFQSIALDVLCCSCLTVPDVTCLYFKVALL